MYCHHLYHPTTPCNAAGHARTESTQTTVDVEILKIIDAVHKSGGKLTLVMLASLARGLQGGSYEVSRGGKNELEKKVKLDLETVACGLGHE